MTRAQFSEAVKIATSDRDLSNVDDSSLHGCGLPEFHQVHTTVEMVAKLVRWQCCGIFAADTIVDSQELDNMAWIARRKFLVV